MSRLRLLSEAELEALRRQVRRCFARPPHDSRIVPATTYLEAYTELRRDVLAAVENAGPSVSLIRLRKLFYYTDPTACAPDKLERPSFGEDFLGALEQYAARHGSETYAPSPMVINAPLRRRVVTVFLLALPLFGLLGWFYRRSQAPPPVWRDNFDAVSPAALQRRGWTLLDFDTSWWNRFPVAGQLTLHTLPGDYWVKPGEPRSIVNVPVRKIEANPFQITISLAGFDPRQIHQQAGLFLFDDGKNRTGNLRVTYGYGEIGAAEPGKQPPGAHIVNIIRQDRNGDVYSASPAFRLLNAAFDSTALDSLFLRVIVEDRHYRVYLKYPYTWNNYVLLDEQDLSFDPAWFGLAAFQGWTRDDGTPKGAAVIPARFNWVEVVYPGKF
jgi:hypothetical protein